MENNRDKPAVGVKKIESLMDNRGFQHDASNVQTTELKDVVRIQMMSTKSAPSNGDMKDKTMIKAVEQSNSCHPHHDNNDRTSTSPTIRMCKPEACAAARQKYVAQKSALANGGATGNSLTETPWHSLKTGFLIAVVLLLIVWIIAYTLLNSFQLL